MRNDSLRPRFDDHDPPSRIDRVGQRRAPLIWAILVAALFITVLMVHFVLGLPPGH